MERKFTSALLLIFLAAIASGLFAIHTYLKNQNVSDARIPNDTTTTDKTLADILKDAKPARSELSRATAAVAEKPKESVLGNINRVKSDQQKITTLREILKSKNDNDSRLDTDFKSLSEQAKIWMRDEYKNMKPESFNEKGTVVFLLGRNLTTPEDFDFLKSVLAEPPCQSLNDCSAPSEPATGEQAHLDSINQTTLAYPQIVSLKALENYLSVEDRPLEEVALNALDTATDSKIDRVSQEARHFLRRYNAEP